MIVGIGVDTIEINRFVLWHTYSRKKLARIFSLEEIDYCLQDKNKSAQRFAVRFAAREALYKALSHTYPGKKVPFLTLCSRTIITKINQVPQIQLNTIGMDIDHVTIHVSLSHSRTAATAFVVIEENK